MAFWFEVHGFNDGLTQLFVVAGVLVDKLFETDRVFIAKAQ